MPSLVRFFKRIKKGLSRRKVKGKSSSAAKTDDATAQEDKPEGGRAGIEPRLELGMENPHKASLSDELRCQDPVSDLQRGVKRTTSLPTVAENGVDGLSPRSDSGIRGLETASAAQSQRTGQKGAARGQGDSEDSAPDDENQALRAFTLATKAAMIFVSRRNLQPEKARGRSAAESFLQAASYTIKERAMVLQARGRDLATPREEELLCQLMNLAQVAVAESRREDYAQTRGNGGDGGVDAADGRRLIRAVATKARLYVIERTHYIRWIAFLAERAIVQQATIDACRNDGELEEDGGSDESDGDNTDQRNKGSARARRGDGCRF